MASAHSTASDLLSDPKVQAMVEAQMALVSQEAVVEAADILREYLALATADASKIMHVRRVNCRYCWGEGHSYQWKAREYAEACDAASKPAKRGEEPAPFPDCSGGFGFRNNAEPNPACPECNGEGHEDIFFRDTEGLTGPERKLIAGIKRTKDGLEVKLRDQDGALKILAQYAGLLIERKELTGKDGRPLIPTTPPADLPNDPQQLGALYSQIVGG
ncbi:MAG: terminase small subunit [Candidatus Paceibacterota bacterium]